MTDILDRLTDLKIEIKPQDVSDYGALHAAKREIERLRTELEEVKAANELLMREPPHGYTNMPNGTVVPYWSYPVKPTT